MTIKQQGGIFGRNPTFNDVTVDGTLSTGGTISTTSNMVIEAGSPNIRFAETDTTDENYRIRVQAGQFIFEKLADNNSIVTECFRVDGSNNLDLKTGSLAVANGQGIDFSATSGTGTSELFSDYEEGSWSPVVRDASSAGNTGGGTVTGNYTKTGRTVFINFAVSNLDTTGMTSGNDLFITGLPYAVATLSGTNYFTGALVMHTVTTAGNQAAAIQDATDYVKLYETISGAAFEFIKVSDISSGVSDIRFSLTYEAA